MKYKCTVLIASYIFLAQPGESIKLNICYIISFTNNNFQLFFYKFNYDRYEHISFVDSVAIATSMGISEYRLRSYLCMRHCIYVKDLESGNKL